MQVAAYAAGGAVAGVLFFRWAARKAMDLCDETWDASVISLRIEMGLYLSACCAAWIYLNYMGYSSLDQILIAVPLWLFGMIGVIFR